VIVEPKLDGVAVSIIYKNSILDSISLRGDGLIGEDVTCFYKYIDNIAMNLNTSYELVDIRGEILVPKHIPNARNYVAGLLRKKFPQKDNLMFIPYDVYGATFQNRIEMLDWLKIRFSICDYIIINHISEDNMDKIHHMWTKQINSDYLWDGLVLKLNDLTYIPSTSRYVKNAIAYKFTENSTSSVVTNINWSINRKGEFIPVVEIEPIVLDSVIKNVSVHNRRSLHNQKINIGSKVYISRIGNVIPHITHAEPCENLNIVHNCAHCNHEVIENPIHYICSNINCIGKIHAQVHYFFKQLNIKGLGTQCINNLLKKITSTNDTYFYYIIEILKILATGNWIQSLHDEKVFIEYKNFKHLSHNIKLQTIIIALGIPGISDEFLKNIPDNIPAIIDLYKDKDLILSKRLVEYLLQYEHHINDIMLLI
jgi:DNA ligase (NAD+)